MTIPVNVIFNLPLSIKNQIGREIAGIYISDDGRYRWYNTNMSEHKCGSYGHDNFIECLEEMLGATYQENLMLLRIVEQHRKLTAALHESLGTKPGW